jgi:hypothetical protein
MVLAAKVPSGALSAPAKTPENEKADLPRLLSLVAQYALLAFVIYYFKLESLAFFQIMVLAFSGQIVHYFLPLRYRLPFFDALSLAAFAMILGPAQAAWLVVIGGLLIGICHLPLKLPYRTGLLLLAGGALAVLRAGIGSVPWSPSIWPILGSIFMFRLIVYLYDRHFDKTPARPAETFSYFFLLPSVCFPLFPVVDYKTFRRTYYDGERHEIHQVGVDWISRGVIQLILYRFVYYFGSMSPTEVADAGDLARYVVSGFLLYLRISGQFHIIVGVLHLFGFNLPETHHRYFLASSFTDFWRRINIYWKDFMMKIFYYPMFFRLRKLGTTPALLLSTVFVFFATWVLHACQWFWLRGSYLFSWTDVLFWTILGALVVIYSLHEIRHGRRRSLGARSWTWRDRIVLILKTAATFVAISVLWSLWTSESIPAWISVWKTAARPAIHDTRLILALIGGAVVFAAAVLFYNWQDARRAAGRRPALFTMAAANIAALATACIIGTPELYVRLLPPALAPTYVAVVGSMREVRLSGHDADMLVRGYYEELLNVQSFNSQLWEVYQGWPIEWSRLEDTGALRLTGDFLKQELVPGKQIHFRNSTLTVNRSGMRDRDYEQVPPSGTTRIALVGSSHVMGYGVNDDQTFDAVLESHLAQEPLDSGASPYEVLNFAVDGYGPLQELRLLEEKVLSFRPSVVLYFAHPGAAGRASDYLEEMVRTGVAIPYEPLRAIVEREGVTAETGRHDGARLLHPHGSEALSWAYRRFSQLCRDHGALPVYMYLPTAGEKPNAQLLAEQERFAGEAGFVVLDLTRCFEGHDPRSIWFGEWDQHPNALGHRLIGEELYRVLRENAHRVFKDLAATPAEPPPANPH